MHGNFIDTLRGLRHGGALDELDTRLAELVASVRETGKGGEINVTLTIKPFNKGRAGDTVIVADKVKCKVPELERDASIFFSTESGTLSVTDPRQGKLPLRSAAGASISVIDQEAAQ